MRILKSLVPSLSHNVNSPYHHPCSTPAALRNGRETLQFRRERLQKPYIIVVHKIQDLVNQPSDNKALQI